MENETDRLIREQLKTLPSSLQQAIQSVQWKNLVREIGEDNELSAEQIASLERETLLIICGFEPLENYLVNIIKEVNLSEEDALYITEDVEKEVLGLIAQKAEELNNKKLAGVPEVAPEIHPMIEEGEVAHDVPLPEERGEKAEPHTAPTPANLPTFEPTQQPTTDDSQGGQSEPSSTQKPRAYPEGQDPYREPIE